MSDLTNCPVCRLEFDDDIRRPKLILCSHTLCLACWKDFQLGKITNCPLCQSGFDLREAPSISCRQLLDSHLPEDETLLRTVLGILNRLTPSNFGKLLSRVQALDFDTDERLSQVIQLFYEKALHDPIYSPTYAKMCQALSSQSPQFRSVLLNRCQKEFEVVKSVAFESALYRDKRQRSLGNIRFIGELFKLRILPVKIVDQIILQLLGNRQDEECLEKLCLLLTIVGKELEIFLNSQSNPVLQSLDSYFNTLESILHVSSESDLSNRIRFMILDVVELRQRSWTPRREDDQVPKTMEQIRMDVIREREELLRSLNITLNKG